MAENIDVTAPHVPTEPPVSIGATRSPSEPQYPESKTGESRLPLPAVLTIGNYLIEKEIGRGGMGIVYKAREVATNRPVAIKVLRGEAATEDPLAINEFLNEAKTAIQLGGIDVVAVLAVVDHDEHHGPFIVMEYIPGGTLGEELRTAKSGLAAKEAARKMLEIARSVDVAHRLCIIHRDLKPSNVLVAENRDGAKHYKVADFGLARRTTVTAVTGERQLIQGTPAYMAPEQARGEAKLTPAADVYALGMILYEMLTGRRPHFDCTTTNDLLARVQYEAIPEPRTLNRRMDWKINLICMRCLDKSPAKRYETAGSLAAELENYLSGGPVSVHNTPFDRGWRAVRRRPWHAVGVATGVLCGFLLVMGIILKHENDKQKALNDEMKHSLTALRTVREFAMSGGLYGDKLADFNTVVSDYFNKSLKDKQPKQGIATDPKLPDDFLNTGRLMAMTNKKEASIRMFRDAIRWFTVATEMADERERDTANEHAQTKNDAGKTLKENRLGLIHSRTELATALLSTDSLTEAGTVLAEARTDCGNQIVVYGEQAAAVQKAFPVDNFTSPYAEIIHLQGQLAGLNKNWPEAIRQYELSIYYRMLALGTTNATHDPVRHARLLRDYARGYGFLGDAYQSAGRSGDADVAYWESHVHRLRAVDVVSQVPDSKVESCRHTFELGVSWYNFASFQYESGATATAEYLTRFAIANAAKAVEGMPSHVGYKTQLAAYQLDSARNALWLNRDFNATELAAATDTLEQYSRLDAGLKGQVVRANALAARAAARTKQSPNVFIDRVEKLVGPSSEAADYYELAAVRALKIHSAFGAERERTADAAIDTLKAAVLRNKFRVRRPDMIRKDPAFSGFADPAFSGFADARRQEFELLATAASEPAVTNPNPPAPPGPPSP